MDASRATPTQLAEEIIRIVRDADGNTASTAIRIAELLLVHRTLAESEFNLQCISEKASQQLDEDIR